MLYKTVIRLLGVARNPANGFPARLLGAKLSGSESLTEKVAAALVVGATIRAEGGVSTTIGWDVDVGNELGTVFYGTVPVVMRVAAAKIDAEPDYDGAMLCIRDAADGWVREKCSDG